MGEWKPIETAPKDETGLLLYVPIESFIFVASAYWNKHYKEWHLAWTGLTNKPIKVTGATHWMPFPDPPK